MEYFRESVGWKCRKCDLHLEHLVGNLPNEIFKTK